MRTFRLLCLVLFSSASVAQEVQAPRDISTKLETLRAKAKVPALGGCLVVHGEVKALGVAGTLHSQTDKKVLADHRWHLGSCTKAMTATLLARFIERGKLRWDTTLPELFPGHAKTMHENYRKVTLRDLVEHTSGMYANPSHLFLKLRRESGADGRKRVLADVFRKRPVHDPLDGMVYSNVGYMMAALALEDLTGKTWEELMRAEIFEPLGMTSAGFGPPKAVGNAGAICGHTDGGDKPYRPAPTGDNPACYGPAGTVHASLVDWSKFVADQLAGAQGKGKLLKKAAYDELHRSAKGGESDSYACGWGVTRRGWAKGPVLSHSGSNTMWFCVVWCSRDEGFAVLATCNVGGAAGTKATDQVASALLRLRKKL